MFKPTAIVILASFLVGLILPLSATAPVRADWTILEYDKNGKLVGVRRGKEPEKGTTTPAQPSQPPAPAEQSETGPQAPEASYKDDEVLVADPPDDFARVASQMGYVVVSKASLGALSVNIFRLRIPRGSTVPAALRQLRARFPGLITDANHLFDPSAKGVSPVQQARLLMKWQERPNSCGDNVRIGAVDGAVDLSHPALEGQRIVYRSFHNPALEPARQDHGTAVAAMLVGKKAWGGLLPAAELKAANIFEKSSSGKVSANAFGLLKAVDWLVSERVHVINLSVAGGTNKIMDKVLRKALRKGVVVAAAAGNGGRSAAPAYPAAYKFVLAVTAVNVKRVVYAQANRGSYVDFAAPGVDIWTAVPGGGKRQSGTSFRSGNC
jgi:subtilisin family serine protease